MNDSTGTGRDDLNRLLAELRPKLHRYCARMTGSVIDGEDVVQEALTKAIEAYPRTEALGNPEAWLFRIAHNAALDHLRRRARHDAAQSDEDPDMIADPLALKPDPGIVATSLRIFMRLPLSQRSSVIMMDVLGYSLEEIGALLDATIPAVKAALHRGRERLRELAREPDNRPPPVLSGPERSLLKRYVDCFNAHDFDTIRNMLADEVRLDLVNRKRMTGRGEVTNYFHNYERVSDWHFMPGLVDGRPAVLVRDPRDASAAPLYIVIVSWTDGRIAAIRDFRYARYVMDGAEMLIDSSAETGV
jgi:RNA polymerase sigma-70 factor (ECF subfamily)